MRESKAFFWPKPGGREEMERRAGGRREVGSSATNLKVLVVLK